MLNKSTKLHAFSLVLLYIVLWAVTLCPCTAYPCLLHWLVLLHIPYLDDLGTKLHFKFSERLVLGNALRGVMGKVNLRV